MDELKYSNGDVDALIAQLRERVDEIDMYLDSGVAIYGAGFLGEWAVQYLIAQDVNVTCFIDRDPAKTGLNFHGVPVYASDDGIVEKQQAVFIAARHVIKEVEAFIGERNPDAISISFDGYFVVKNYERLCRVRDSFLSHEARSVETFNAILIAMLTGSVESCMQVMEKDMYFGLPEFSGTFEDTFVDAGAFVGDTVERFIWENLGTFKHIYAFEPGKRQYKALLKRLERLSEEWAFEPSDVSAVHAGLSSERSTMTCTFTDDAPLRHGLSPESNSESEECVDVLTLDEYLDGRPVNFIKADVEGMEVALLKGAEQTIKTCKPKMALCIYHYPSDLYEIAEIVRDMVPEYQFKLRQHVPLFGDFVLYCFCKGG